MKPCIEVRSVARVADAKEARRALVRRDRSRCFSLVGRDGDGGDRKNRERDGRRDRAEGSAVRVGVGRLGAIGNRNARRRTIARACGPSTRQENGEEQERERAGECAGAGVSHLEKTSEVEVRG